MTLTLAVVSLAVAVFALLRVRSQARAVAQLREMYWQLKYDHGELKASVAPPQADSPSPVAGFVPLASLKRPPS
ncbi:MAG: hypothetical protein OEW19_18325 [Acidobacteriota bacterium]|nr:hypothetical protein [Acidobacteriota bacterium]